MLQLFLLQHLFGSINIVEENKETVFQKFGFEF